MLYSLYRLHLHQLPIRSPLLLPPCCPLLVLWLLHLPRLLLALQPVCLGTLPLPSVRPISMLQLKSLSISLLYLGSCIHLLHPCWEAAKVALRDKLSLLMRWLSPNPSRHPQ